MYYYYHYVAYNPQISIHNTCILVGGLGVAPKGCPERESSQREPGICVHMYVYVCVYIYIYTYIYIDIHIIGIHMSASLYTIHEPRCSWVHLFGSH